MRTIDGIAYVRNSLLSLAPPHRPPPTIPSQLAEGGPGGGGGAGDGSEILNMQFQLQYVFEYVSTNGYCTRYAAGCDMEQQG